MILYYWIIYFTWTAEGCFKYKSTTTHFGSTVQTLVYLLPKANRKVHKIHKVAFYLTNSSITYCNTKLFAEKTNLVWTNTPYGPFISLKSIMHLKVTTNINIKMIVFYTSVLNQKEQFRLIILTCNCFSFINKDIPGPSFINTSYSKIKPADGAKELLFSVPSDYYKK